MRKINCDFRFAYRPTAQISLLHSHQARHNLRFVSLDLNSRKIASRHCCINYSTADSDLTASIDLKVMEKGPCCSPKKLSIDVSWCCISLSQQNCTHLLTMTLICRTLLRSIGLALGAPLPRYVASRSSNLHRLSKPFALVPTVSWRWAARSFH